MWCLVSWLHVPLTWCSASTSECSPRERFECSWCRWREWGEQQSSGCISRVFVSECAWTVGFGAAGEGQKGGRDGVYAAATLIQVSHQKSPPSLLNWQQKHGWTVRKTLVPTPDFVHMGYKTAECFQQKIFQHMNLWPKVKILHSRNYCKQNCGCRLV